MYKNQTDRYIYMKTHIYMHIYNSWMKRILAGFNPRGLQLTFNVWSQLLYF